MNHAVYLRLSKEDDESNSINNQRREAIKFNPNFEEYNEGEGKSGTKDEKERPELKRLIEDIIAGKIKSVWMRKQDRLARSGLIVLTFADTARKLGVKLFFGDKGEVNLNDPVEYFQLTIMAAVDELKPHQQSKATRQALADNRAEGKVKGNVPYGYRVVNMYPQTDADEVKVINRMFQMYLNGDGPRHIANVFNEENIKSKYAKMAQAKLDKGEDISNNKLLRADAIWSPSVIRNLLQCTWYIGTRTEKGETYEVPPIVDETLFYKVQKSLELRKGKRVNTTPANNYLLRGILKCGKCGKNYIGRTRKKSEHINYYYCNSKRNKSTNCGSHSIRINELDSFIVKYLFKSKNLINKIKEIQSDNTVLNQLNTEISDTQNKIKTLENRIDNYAVLLGDKLKDDDIILNKFLNAKNQIGVLKESLRNLKVDKANLTESKALADYETLYNNFDASADFKTIQTAVHSIVETITITTEYLNLEQYVKEGRTSYTEYFHNKVVYNINIKYLGFNEESHFITTAPYDKWLITQHYKKSDDGQDIELLPAVEYQDDFKLNEMELLPEDLIIT